MVGRREEGRPRRDVKAGKGGIHTNVKAAAGGIHTNVKAAEGRIHTNVKAAKGGIHAIHKKAELSRKGSTRFTRSQSCRGGESSAHWRSVWSSSWMRLLASGVEFE